MALIKCDDCGSEVSSRAPACPKCGAPIAQGSVASPVDMKSGGAAVEAAKALGVSGQPEKTLVENPFGTVTTKRVVYFRDKGWFNQGSREDIPLQHVTSVRLETKRQIILGVVLLLLALAFFGNDEVFFGVATLAAAIVCFLGSPTVVVNTAGRDLQAASGSPWQTTEAEAFVVALRSQLFKE